ncbi:MAG: hypothetical protein Q8N51_09720 [Gammaproteobacteria bacterium]|nr:hypothetical protein [Gammaproteobacteria bacterium]
MKIEDLINTLEELAEIHPGIEVRLMTQHSWPFENNIQGITTTSAMDEAEHEDEISRLQDLGISPEDAEDAEAAECQSKPSTPAKEEVVYLVEGRQLGYGRKSAWTTCIC